MVVSPQRVIAAPLAFNSSVGQPGGANRRKLSVAPPLAKWADDDRLRCGGADGGDD